MTSGAGNAGAPIVLCLGGVHAALFEEAGAAALPVGSNGPDPEAALDPELLRSVAGREVLVSYPAGSKGMAKEAFELAAALAVQSKAARIARPLRFEAADPKAQAAAGKGAEAEDREAAAFGSVDSGPFSAKARAKAWIEEAGEGPEADPGTRLEFPYAEAEIDDGLGGCARVRLHYRLKYQRGRESYLPRWERQEIGAPKEKGGLPSAVWKEVPVLPYLWQRNTLVMVEASDGEAQIGNPDFPSKVEEEMEGITDDLRRVLLKVSPDADHKDLSRLGFHVSPDGMSKWREIMKAQRGANSSKSKWGTAHKGWIRFPGADHPHYVCGDRVFAPEGGVDLRAVGRGFSGTAAQDGVLERGTWEGWRRAFSLALENPCAAALSGFAASAALLSRVSGMEPGIFNLVGGSGRGKTTMLKALASLVGSAEAPSEATSYIQSWRMTENALEAPLQARSDAPALLDELHALSAKADVMSLLYMAANGRGKGRMTKEIEARLVKVWKTQMVSSGEGSFAQRLREAGHDDLPGGLQFRVIDIPVDAVPFWAHVAEQAALPGLGAYGALPAVARSSSAAPAARAIEALDAELQAHCGHFWERWIRFLQTEEGIRQARSWFDNERSALAIPVGASPVFSRRSKHVAACMAGLRGILAVGGWDEAFCARILAAARAWAVDHLWGAGLASTKGGETEQLLERFGDWLVSNEMRLLCLGVEPNRDALGWIDPKGAAAVSCTALKSACGKELKLDYSRLELALEGAGWEKGRKRHPRGGRAAHPVRVWFREGVFRAEGDSAEA